MKMAEKFKQSKFYAEWVKLCQDLKPMTFSQKVEHIWTYYKEIILIVAALLLAVILVISGLSKNSKDTLLHGSMVNLSMEQSGVNYLTTDYFQKLGGDEKKEEVLLEYTYFGDLEDPQNSDYSYYSSMALIAQVENKMLDYMLLDKYAMEYYIIQDIYFDLSAFFTEAELAELSEHLIYAQYEGTELEDRWPIAVDISWMDFVKDNVNSDGGVYFALSGRTQHLEQCRDLWEYMKAWESPQE